MISFHAELCNVLIASPGAFTIRALDAAGYTALATVVVVQP